MKLRRTSCAVFFVCVFLTTSGLAIAQTLAPIVPASEVSESTPAPNLAPIVQPSAVQETAAAETFAPVVQASEDSGLSAVGNVAPIVQPPQVPDTVATSRLAPIVQGGQQQTPSPSSVVLGVGLGTANPANSEPSPVALSAGQGPPAPIDQLDSGQEGTSVLRGLKDSSTTTTSTAPPDVDRCGPSCDEAPLDSWRRLLQGRLVAFGEFTYLRPRDAGVAYAVPIEGPISDPPANYPIQVGSVGVADPDYQPGFRAGIGAILGDSRMVVGRWWKLESSTTDRTAVDAPDVIRSLVAHPSSTSAATDFLEASASYDIDFDLVDVELQDIWRSGCNYAVRYSVGARYARLQQDFQSIYVNTGTEQVTTAIGFDGGGIRLGLEGQRFSPYRGFHLYGRGAASFVGGQFRARYFQGQAFDPVVVETQWKSGRVVTILDIEARVGWQSQDGRCRVTAGYLFSGWLNAATTDDLITSVQSNRFLGLGDTLSFDGLTTGIEVRY